MGKMFVNGLLAGTAAAVIWISCAMLAGLSPAAVGGFSLVFLVGTCALVTVVGGLIQRGVSAQLSG